MIYECVYIQLYIYILLLYIYIYIICILKPFQLELQCRGPWPYRFYEDFSGIQPELSQKSGGIRHHLGISGVPKLELVGGFKHEFYFPFHIWDVILPIDELHHFSRWLYKTTNQRGTVPYKATFFWGISPYIALKNRPEICWAGYLQNLGFWSGHLDLIWAILGPFPIDELGYFWALKFAFALKLIGIDGFGQENKAPKSSVLAARVWNVRTLPLLLVAVRAEGPAAWKRVSGYPTMAFQFGEYSPDWSSIIYIYKYTLLYVYIYIYNYIDIKHK